jgi:lipopolysaccharide export system permease protein
MPILWRYALQSYLRVFSLSICTFIAVLIVARFKDIARFAALSYQMGKTGLFIVYQIPTILPIAIPISALIASLLLFQRLSRTYELTAFRAAGLSLFQILSPLLFLSALLAVFSFSINIEMAPFCRREGKTLIYHETTQNPLLLLQRQKLVKLKHAYLDMAAQNDETTHDLTLVAYNESNQRLNLLSAKKLWMEGADLLGDDLAIVSYIGEKQGFDTLIIENQSSMSTSAPLLSTALKKNRPHLDINALSLKSLRLYKKQKGALIEILRRISLSLAVFSFTFLGCAFGIENVRSPKKTNLLFVLLLTLTVLMSYLLGKGLKNSMWLAAFALLLPHPFIWACSTFHLYRIGKGRI